MKKILAICASLLLTAGAMFAQELANFNFGGRGARVVSPEIQGDSVTFRLRRKSLLRNLSRWSVRYHANKNTGNILTASGHPLPVFFFGSELCRLVVN